MLKRLIHLAAVPALVAGLLMATTATSNASNGDFRITGVNVKWKNSITSGGCRDIPVSLSFDSPYYVEDIYADVEIWRGSRNADVISPYSLRGSKVQGAYYWCSFDGFGTFRAGPSRGDWCDVNYDCFRWSSNKTKKFAVKQGSRFTALKSSKSGRTRTFTGRAQYFKAVDYTNAWVGRSKGTKVTLQRKSGNSWKTVRTTKARKKGAFTIKVKANKRHTYRVVSAGGQTVWAGTSKAMKR